MAGQAERTEGDSLAFHPTAACATELAAGAPEWVQLLPRGEVRTRPHDGRAPWRLEDPEAVIGATRALVHDLPIDYEHQTDKAAENGQPAPAAGWIKELAARDDGIHGRVAWTDKARSMLEGREYRFLSPVFQFDRKTREIKRVMRAALTNDPAIFLTAIAKREESIETVRGARDCTPPGRTRPI